MLADDRNAVGVEEDHSVLHPASLGAIKLVAAADAGKPVCVCGESAADPAIAGLLIGFGIRKLSMSPAASTLTPANPRNRQQRCARPRDRCTAAQGR